MSHLSLRDLDIEYDVFGADLSPPLLLVMGLGYQMIEWEEGLCTRLADRGFRVIRYDNRDVGLSTKLDAPGVPDILAVALGTAEPAYTLDEMADDGVALLDGLGIAAAHVVGVSMGGMIAQLIAIRHPDRVLSLTSIMSTVGGPAVVQAEQAVLENLLTPIGPTRDERIERSLATRRLINGAGIPFDDERSRRQATLAVDRCFHPEGMLRQLAAILAAPDRAPALRKLEMPSLVIHGEADPLVPPENGRQTAAALRGARLMMIPGMGHNLPERLWPDVVDAIVENTGARD
jgi:pimeloyl-ACP methyl ester carboxylesterase